MDKRTKSKCYCGPYYFSQSVKCKLSKWFNIPCRKHDRDYRKNKGRILSDLKFYVRCFEASEKNALKHTASFIFFVMVILFGWISYYYGGEKGEEKE